MATTRRSSGKVSSTQHQPEPVLIIYHVKAGSEKQLEDLLRQTWKIYQREHLVFDEPHICLRVKEDAGNVRFVEMFTWVGFFATEHPPDSVKRLWEQMRSLCEDRNGNMDVEVRKAEVLLP